MPTNHFSSHFRLALQGGLLLGLAGLTPAAAQSFSATKTDYAAGVNPLFAMLADVNADNLPDLISANGGSSNYLTVRLGTGVGTFATSFSTITTNGASGHVVVQDVNADGRADLIVTNTGGNGVSVHLADPATAGSFLPHTFYVTGNFPFNTEVADVNGDGRPDLVTANYFGNTVRVRLASTTTPGTFLSTFTDYTTTGGTSQVMLRDINADGRLDMLTSHLSTNVVEVRLASGAAGNFSTTPISYATGTQARDLEVVDVNGDGRLDLVTAGVNSGVSVRLADAAGAAGSFLPTFTTYASTGNGVDVDAVDVNADGRPDLISVGTNTNTVSVRLASGAAGSFAATYTDYATGLNPQSVAVVDVNGDTMPDLLTANYDSNNISLRLNTMPVPPAPTLTAATPTPGGLGQSITVTGTTLTNPTALTINGANALPNIISNDGSTLVVRVPVGASTGSGTLSLSTSRGTATLPFSVMPPPGNALALDGTLDYVSLPAGLTAAVQSFTFESWVNYTTAATWSRVMDFGTGTTVNMFLTPRGGSGTIRFAITTASGGGEQQINTTVTMPTGSWHHLAVTLSKNTSTNVVTGTLYLDGQVIGTNANMTLTPASLGSTTQNWLGRSQYADPYLSATLDEVRLWSVARTQAQVQAGMLAPPTLSDPGLLAYYNFDQGTPGGNNTGLTTLYDLVGARPATLNSFDLSSGNTTSNYVTSRAMMPPTISSFTPGSGGSGTTVVITGTRFTGLSGASAVTFGGVNAASYTVNSSTQITAVTAAGTGSGVVQVNTPDGTGTSATSFEVDLVVSSGTLVAPTNVLAGSYRNLTVTSTGVARLGGAVSLSGVAQVQGALLTNCQPLAGTGSFTLAAGATLGICDAAGLSSTAGTGAVRMTGSRSFSTDATYLYNGTAAQVTGNGLPTTVRNLTLSNASGLTLSQPTSVAQVLTLTSGVLTSTTTNMLTLRSVANQGTALAVHGSGSTSGPITVQRAIEAVTPDNIGYHHFSAPVSNTTINDLANADFTPVLNPAYNTAASAGTVRPFPTVFGYDERRLTPANGLSGTAASSVATDLPTFEKGYFSPASGDAMTVGCGYTVNMANAALPDFVGTLNTGPVNTTGLTRGSDAAAGWHLLGNPYPAPLDWSTVAAGQRTNLEASAYVYHATSQYGGYYTTYLGSLVTNGPNGQTAPLIPAAAGFFVRATANGAALSLTNANRVTTFGAQPAFGRQGTAGAQLKLALTSASGVADELTVYTAAAATMGFDAAYDASKMTNPTGLNLAAVATTGEALAIAGVPAFAAGTTVPLRLATPIAGTYTLTTTALANLPVGLRAYLRDVAIGQQIDLSAQPTVRLALAAGLNTRYSLVFAPAGALATASGLTAAQVVMAPNPAAQGVGVTVSLPVAAGQAATVEVRDALGRVVVPARALAVTAGQATGVVPTASLAAGVYVLRLTAGAATVSTRLVVE